MLMARTCLTRVSMLPSCSRLHASLSINLPSWDTPRRTADDILSIVGAPGRGVRAISMSNKMVHFVGSLSLPQPGHIFTVRSISWIINADRVGELLELVQIDSAPIIPAPTTIDPISKPLPRSPSSTTRHPLPHYQRRQINNDDLIESIDRVGLKLADCLSIAESALTTLVQRRPPFDPNLSEAARETLRVTALPFGLTNVTATCQDALWGKFADQILSTIGAHRGARVR